MTNLIVLLAGLFILAFIALLWLRQNMLLGLDALRHNEQILQKDYEKFRDLVPFLLEGARENAEVTDAWKHLVEQRQKVQGNPSITEEVDFENEVKKFYSEFPATTRSVLFLEAKKDLQELSSLIEGQKEKMRTLATQFNQKRKEFPYSLASGIFGIREVTPL